MALLEFLSSLQNGLLQEGAKARISAVEYRNIIYWRVDGVSEIQIRLSLLIRP